MPRSCNKEFRSAAVFRAYAGIEDQQPTLVRPTLAQHDERPWLFLFRGPRLSPSRPSSLGKIVNLHNDEVSSSPCQSPNVG